MILLLQNGSRCRCFISTPNPSVLFAISIAAIIIIITSSTSHIYSMQNGISQSYFHPIPTFLLSYSPFIAFSIHHSLPSHLPMKPSQKNLSYITTQGIHPTQQSNPPQSQSTHFTPPGCLCPHPPKDKGFVIEIVLVALAVEVVLGGIVVYR